MADVVIHTKGLVKDYGATRALAGVDLAVERREIFGFLGPNGAGKSTTIRVLLDLLRPTAGHVEVLGVPPARGGPALRVRIGARRRDDRRHRDAGRRARPRCRGRQHPGRLGRSAAARTGLRHDRAGGGRDHGPPGGRSRGRRRARGPRVHARRHRADHRRRLDDGGVAVLVVPGGAAAVHRRRRAGSGAALRGAARRRGGGGRRLRTP
ncbi:MAG: ATP-binding cassette domain-containing protein [Actinobacteria bacterium]|nr:ATP-binding cassette domain-containing protein [Actinomycetota bacterium]